MNRRYFFEKLASGLVAAAAPTLFLPKLIKPGWKVPHRPKRVAHIDMAAPNKDFTVTCHWQFAVTEEGGLQTVEMTQLSALDVSLRARMSAPEKVEDLGHGWTKTTSGHMLSYRLNVDKALA